MYIYICNIYTYMMLYIYTYLIYIYISYMYISYIIDTFWPGHKTILFGAYDPLSGPTSANIFFFCA